MTAMIHSLQAAEVQLLHLLNTARIPALDPVLHLLTNTAYLIGALCMATIGVFALLKRSPQLICKASLLVGGVGSSAVIAYILKHEIARVRPFVSHPHLITQLADASRLSFPSGHTTVAFATAFMVAGLYRGKVTTKITLAWATAVGYSRMALGVHYPSDVLGGVLISAVACSLVLRFGKVPVEYFLRLGNRVTGGRFSFVENTN